jgi:hypothetical protein
VTEPIFAPVVALPLCPACRHLWPAHWSDEGCQAPTGPAAVCGCGEIPPDDPEHPDYPDDDPADDEHGEEQAA